MPTNLSASRTLTVGCAGWRASACKKQKIIKEQPDQLFPGGSVPKLRNKEEEGRRKSYGKHELRRQKEKCDYALRALAEVVNESARG